MERSPQEPKGLGELTVLFVYVSQIKSSGLGAASSLARSPQPQAQVPTGHHRRISRCSLSSPSVIGEVEPEGLRVPSSSHIPHPWELPGLVKMLVPLAVGLSSVTQCWVRPVVRALGFIALGGHPRPGGHHLLWDRMTSVLLKRTTPLGPEPEAAHRGAEGRQARVLIMVPPFPAGSSCLRGGRN